MDLALAAPGRGGGAHRHPAGPAGGRAPGPPPAPAAGRPQLGRPTAAILASLDLISPPWWTPWKKNWPGWRAAGGQGPGTGHPGRALPTRAARTPRTPWRNWPNWPAPPASKWPPPSSSTATASTPALLMGKGNLAELVIQALQLGADLLVFDAELSPSQVRSITDFTELRVIDRTQLILDLFAQRARSREGKLQVEMAQVKYLLPRLVGRGRRPLPPHGRHRRPGAGGNQIGDRPSAPAGSPAPPESGPGRRCGTNAGSAASRRKRQRLPVLSIIGYTNAGKSTLFNALTHASVSGRGPALRHPGPHQPPPALPPGTGGDHHRHGGLHPKPPQESAGGLQGHPGGVGGGRPADPRGRPEQPPFPGADGHGGRYPGLAPSPG